MTSEDGSLLPSHHCNLSFLQKRKGALSVGPAPDVPHALALPAIVSGRKEDEGRGIGRSASSCPLTAARSPRPGSSMTHTLARVSR